MEKENQPIDEIEKKPKELHKKPYEPPLWKKEELFEKMALIACKPGGVCDPEGHS